MDVLHKHIPALRTLAAKTHPEDDDAQEGFVLDHLTKASKTLGLAGVHEDNALEAYESFDEDAKPAPPIPHVNAPRTESPKTTGTTNAAPVKERRKPVTKKRKK